MNYPTKRFVTAIIVAAGESTRMGNGINKQMMSINGKPVLAHAVEAFDKSNLINSIVIVARKSDYKNIQKMVDDCKFVKVSTIVEGGDYRQQSVFNGVEAAPKASTHFAIHDAARALIEPELINKVVLDAISHKAAILGVRVKDSIKLIDEKSFIKGSVNRNFIYLAQTPQVFEKTIYLDAMKKAQRDDKIYSDDCQLIEKLNLPVFMTIGSYDNIKITTAEDIPVAENILTRRTKNV